MKDIIDTIYKDLGNPSDLITREMTICNNKVYFLFSEVLTNGELINKYILDSLSKASFLEVKLFNLYDFITNTLPTLSIVKINKNDIIKYVLDGYTIIITDNFIIATETKQSLDSGINKTNTENVLEGPKDSFCENYNKNLGLLRKRLKTCYLWIDNYDIGRVSKTKIGVGYLNNLVNKELVSSITKIINKLDIDYVTDINHLKTLISNEALPTMMVTERPDKVIQALNEGKIILLLDNSPYMLIIPTFFIDYFRTSDDYYQKYIFMLFSRIVRYISFFLAIFLPGIFISLTTHNPSNLPLSLLSVFYAQRLSVPFPAFIESLILILSFEVLKESDVRSNLGNSISILGGLILGSAAVEAGILSPIMIIVVAFSIIASLVFPSREFSNLIRTFRLVVILLGSLLGIYGCFLGFIILLNMLNNTKVLGLPYLYPISPFNKEEFNKRFKYRNHILSKDNITRSNL